MRKSSDTQANRFQYRLFPRIFLCIGKKDRVFKIGDIFYCPYNRPLRRRFPWDIGFFFKNGKTGNFHILAFAYFFVKGSYCILQNTFLNELNKIVIFIKLDWCHIQLSISFKRTETPADTPNRILFVQKKSNHPRKMRVKFCHLVLCIFYFIFDITVGFFLYNFIGMFFQSVSHGSFYFRLQ